MLLLFVLFFFLFFCFFFLQEEGGIGVLVRSGGEEVFKKRKFFKI